jgi:hypothetical protein
LIEAAPYEPADAEGWDELVGLSPMATFLHSRRFLGYHGDRFDDASMLIRDEGKLLGVIPAAADPADPESVVSHPGATFGGIVHDGALGGERMLESLTALSAAYGERSFRRLVYKAVPSIYHQVPSADDLYALFRLGARRTRVDLSSAIDLAHRRRPSSRRRRGLKKARDAGLQIEESPGLVPDLWRLVEENLQSRHGVSPVHSLGEITALGELFPEDMRFLCATLDGQVVAGTVLFLSPNVMHVQYNAAAEAGRDIGALDGLFEHCFEEAGRLGAGFLDFGISTESQGRELNHSLYEFKTEFGGGGVAHEFYELDLD